MSCRVALAVALLFCILLGTASAQPGDRDRNMKARVLDILFPLDAAERPYFLKMILRYGDSDTQLVVLVYPDRDKYWIRRYEMISYSLTEMGNGGLAEFISKVVTE